MTLIINNLEEIQLKIEKAANRVGRQVADVSIIAVTKQVSTERAIEALDAGLNQLGENRPEGLLEKENQLLMVLYGIISARCKLVKSNKSSTKLIIYIL